MTRVNIQLFGTDDFFKSCIDLSKNANAMQREHIGPILSISGSHFLFKIAELIQ